MDTKDSANAFKAGLFILISFGIAIAIFFGITGSSMYLGRSRELRVAFDLTEDIGGLKAGNDVRVGGLLAGKVKSVCTEFEGDSPRTIVTFRLPEKYMMSRDAKIVVQAGLTGAVNLNIVSLGQGELASSDFIFDGIGPSLPRAIDGLADAAGEITATVRDVRSTTLPRVNTAVASADKLFNTADSAAEQIRITAADADELVKHVRTKVDPVVERYNVVATNAGDAMANVRDVLGDTKGDIRATMANLADATATLREKLPVISDKVAGVLDRFALALDDTKSMLVDVKQFVENGRDVAAGVRSVVTANRSRIDEIVKSVAATSSNLELASGEIRRSPWRLLYKPKPGEVANQNLYDAARQFADGARRLHDSATALRDLSRDPNATSAEIQKLIDELQGSFENFDRLERSLWEQVAE